MQSTLPWALGLTALAVAPIALISWLTNRFLDLGIPLWGHAVAIGAAAVVIFITLVALKKSGAAGGEANDD